MKKAGIHPRRSPVPAPLLALPCRWMVLSAIMLSMATVSLAGLVPPGSPPVTWVEAVGDVRSLWHPVLPRKRKPPDPPLVGEGMELLCSCFKQMRSQLLLPDDDPILSEEEAAAFDSLKFITGCSGPMLQALESWDDLFTHVECHTASSFGPLGLLAKEDDGTAIVDTGASLTITPFKADFLTYEPQSGKVIKGLAQGSAIAGVGTIAWLIEVGGEAVEVKLRALHVPDAGSRLLCPQQLKKEWLPSGFQAPKIGDEGVELFFPQGTVVCPYNESNLPILVLSSPKDCQGQLQALHASLTMETNQNLTAAQKELLRWHWKLGHMDLRRIQRLLKTGALGDGPLVKAASKVDLNKFPMKCGSCEFSKAKRQPSRPKRQKAGSSIPKAEKILSNEVLIPGQKVSMDHFIVSTPGRLFSSRGRESHDRMLKGGVIFVDHASNYVWVEPVVNFTAGEALRAKRAFEREMSSMGVTVLNYHTDNGVFKATEFQDELIKGGQGITFSGVGAHHQNAMAERAIGVTVSLARTMMLHAKLRWPKAIQTVLWPMALKHAQHLVNHVPNHNNVCPMDLVLKTTVPRHALKNLHVWGCPAYVLDPKLQDSGHIPKFDPRSRRGIHLGWSPLHASTVPLILNLTTGSVSPQFHVVFDDWFSTVDSNEMSTEDDIVGEQWNQLLSESRFHVLFDEDDPGELDDEWLTEMERLEKHQRAVQRVQERLPSLPPEARKPPDSAMDLPRVPTPAELPPSLAPKGPKPQRELPSQRELPQQREPPKADPTPSRLKREVSQLKDSLSSKELPSRRSRPAVGRFKGMVAGMIALLGNQTALAMAASTVGNPAAQLAMNGFDAVTETFDNVEFHTYQALSAPKSAKKKGRDPDYPTYAQAMLSPDAEEWKAAMDQEMQVLIKMGTWTVVPRSMALKLGRPVIKTTWAFRQKRNPAGIPTKKKARACVRGDLQKKFDELESYSPVVQWSSVRLMLILSIVHRLETRQVDYVNAFAQADIEPGKDIFIEIPQGYEHMNDVDCVLKLNKSLYGMTDAPLMFFELLKKNLLDSNFKQIDHIDPCLFVHKKAICLTYVDDCLWFGKDGAALDRIIEEMKGKMELKVESNDVSAFLGIQFTRKGDTIELKQLGLIDKVLEATGMKQCKTSPVPAEAKPLGKDVDGAPFSENWNYRSVVGMLLYLSGNSRPDITFAVNQAARFSHDPKQSHAVAVKKILRYLQGTKDRGLIFKPTNDWKVDCYVDADFCGLWGSEDPDDPIVTKSRTGYVITLAGCPLLWASKLQTETSVSTMMAEYVALSSAMRELLPLKRLVKTVAKVVTGSEQVQMNMKSDVFEDNNGALTVATLPRITPQSKFFAVKYHFFKEHVKTDSNPNGEIDIHKIDTTKQLADLMTKGLVPDKFNPLRDSLMGWDLDESGKSKLFANLHSRGNVENVSLDLSLLKMLTLAV